MAKVHSLFSSSFPPPANESFLASKKEHCYKISFIWKRMKLLTFLKVLQSASNILMLYLAIPAGCWVEQLTNEKSVRASRDWSTDLHSLLVLNPLVSLQLHLI